MSSVGEPAPLEPTPPEGIPDPTEEQLLGAGYTKNDKGGWVDKDGNEFLSDDAVCEDYKKRKEIENQQ